MAERERRRPQKFAMVAKRRRRRLVVVVVLVVGGGGWWLLVSFCNHVKNCVSFFKCRREKKRTEGGQLIVDVGDGQQESEPA